MSGFKKHGYPEYGHYDSFITDGESFTVMNINHEGYLYLIDINEEKLISNFGKCKFVDPDIIHSGEYYKQIKCKITYIEYILKWHAWFLELKFIDKPSLWSYISEHYTFEMDDLCFEEHTEDEIVDYLNNYLEKNCEG